MGRIFGISAFVLTCACALGQQGGNQGPYQGDGTTQGVERAISTYLNGNELKSILTPGDPLEWQLELKAGQVVVAEARSETFDPAMEIATKDKVLSINDDRYPGDQRPLLFWRCEQDGTYFLRVRSFRDKAGGQVLVRFKTYHSIDLSSGEKVEKEMDARAPFLLRIPMKAGQLKDVVADMGGNNHYMSFYYNQVIASNGLPDINLSKPLSGAVTAVMAPVAGDYYIMYTPSTDRDAKTGRVRVGTRDVIPGKLTKEGNAYIAKAPTNVPTLWEIDVKKGEFLEASATDLHLQCKFVLAEVPDVSKHDLSKPETNPFFPRPRVANEEPFDELPARARDGRITVFHVKRDAKLWLATNGLGPENKQFTVRVKPAAEAFAADGPNAGKLRIGNTDYWAFNANAGDVMTLNTNAANFAQHISVRDPDLEEIRESTAAPDQTTENWRMIVQKPGRYLVAVSCLGDGGGGEYSLSRKVFQAKEFNLAVPAKAQIGQGDIQIWKFTATPNNPLLIRWSSDVWAYDISIYNEKGQQADFQRQAIDDHSTLGILRVDRPQTFVIVLTGNGAKANYAIELSSVSAIKTGGG
jgi:hypothetical protein